ncbi:hypothetical protein R6Q59_009891 [Mikania micrantha]
MPTKLYAFGSNGAGQLGVGHQDDLSSPKASLFNSPTAARRQSNTLPHGASMKKLVAGGNHTLVLTDDFHLYAAGNNSDGRCGNLKEDSTLRAFSPIAWAEGRNVTDIAATWEASFFIENGHTVWTCGTGNKGELGLGEEVVASIVPRQVFTTVQMTGVDIGIVQISASMGHVLILLSNGEVLGWGSCRKGQLGEDLKAEKVVWTPQKVILPFRASGIVTGRDFTVFLSTEQKIAMCGAFGFCSEVEQLHGECRSLDLSAGWSSLYDLSQGRVRGIGHNRRGQLPPRELPPVRALAAGSEHGVALLDDGRIAAWGWGEHGNCGLPLDDRGNVMGRFNSIFIPSDVDERLMGVGAGCASSFIWTKTGS